MQKINNETMNIIVRNMPEVFRHLYEAGETIRITVIRQRNLKGYGRSISLRIWRGAMIDSDMTEYFPAERIARDVIGFFLNGEKAPVRIGYDGTDSVWNGDYGIRFAI